MSVLCYAPATSVLIDTSKGLRPCCLYQDGFLGTLKKDNIINIFHNEKWTSLRDKMESNEWPAGCLICKDNEKVVGTSLRQNHFNYASEEDVVNKRLTYIEFNGSNICNLSCVHCHSTYSSRWHNERKRIERLLPNYAQPKQELIKKFHIMHNNVDDGELMNSTHLPDPELILSNLKTLDLNHLRMISFRGGEPFLNSETKVVLEYLLEKNLLENIDILITTNCTYVTDEYVSLLNHCKSVCFNLSIDGIDELFNYIRYGDAKFSDVEPVIAKLNQIRNANLNVSTAPMNYNAFDLIKIRDWTRKLSEIYTKLNPMPGFNNCVVHPAYLSLRTLSDKTRNNLVKYYSDNSIDNEFVYVINVLSSGFIGNEIHQQWIDYTNYMQEIRNNDIVSIVPQLANELICTEKNNGVL